MPDQDIESGSCFS